MSDEGRGFAPNPGYIAGLLGDALRTATSDEDEATRKRAEAKIQRFTAVLDGMRSGSIAVGSRAPVEGAPTWATLEVVKGGFATGRLLAGGALREHERAKLTAISTGDFASDRARLNAHFLSSDGLAELRAMLRDGTFRVEVPEEGALLVVAWLLAHNARERAVEVLEAIAPFFDRLRFYPIPSDLPLSESSVVSLTTAHEVAEKLRQTRTPSAILAMRRSLAWAPLSDRLVAMLVETVDGAPLAIARDELGALVRDAKGNFVIDGGTVGARVSDEWIARANALLRDVAAMRSTAAPSKRYTSRQESFSILLAAVEALALGRDLGTSQRHVRRVLATALHKRGAPGSEQLSNLRAQQARARTATLKADVARSLAQRLDRVEREAGIAAIEAFMRAIDATEASDPVPEGTEIPTNFESKLARALEAPLDELVHRGVITSGEVLAIVAPKVTSQVRAAGVIDAELRRLYAAIYAAFRKRRSLLLLDLEKQVSINELPWITAINAFRTKSMDARMQSKQTLEQLATLAITGFPEAILPNKLLRELSALAAGAELRLPIVEELAADIFMGAFSDKFVDSAKMSAAYLKGSLYERYYGLPFERVLAIGPSKGKFGGNDAFAKLCNELARADESAKSWSVARNGTIIEAQQLLTTHNLAPLFATLSLRERLGEATLVSLAQKSLRWVLAQHAQKLPRGHAQLVRMKNTAYAWRQMVFFLSLVSLHEQRAFVRWADEQLARAKEPFCTRFAQAIRGLALAIDGGSFDAEGAAKHNGQSARRFLGWVVGSHWLFDEKPKER
ncbi:MAG: hypothetical protein U0269_05855 [Polyangiales bacterium]